MGYTKQNFKSGEVLMASQLNAMDEQILANETAIETKQPKGDYVTKSFTDSTYQVKGSYLTQHQELKTINGFSLLGSGNIKISVDENNYMIPNPVDLSYYSGKTIACIGDSVTAGVGATTNYVSRLGTALGMNVINLGVSGTVLCTGGHRTCNIGKLSNLGSADYVTILMGINDWDQAKEGYYSLGEMGSTDTTTIYGAVKMWCDKIMELKGTETYKNTKFYFMTPLITSWNNSVGSKSWDQSKVNIHGYTLRDLCKAIIEVCDVYEIPVIDLNLYSGIYYNNADDQNASTYGGDGIHPNDGGHELVTNAIVKLLGLNPTYTNAADSLNYLLSELSKLLKTDISYPGISKEEFELIIPLVSIILSESSLNLTEGQQVTLTATLNPSNTTQSTINWESSNTSVATVSNGVVKGISVGDATITCKSVQNPNITASVSVNVTANESTDLVSLTISDETATVNVGETKTISVNYIPSNTEQTGVTWTSSDSEIASVTPNEDGKSCVVNALSLGQCYITATSAHNDSITAQCFFTCSDPNEEPTTWVLGSNAILNEDGTVTASISGNTYGNINNVAIYDMPLKAGMQVEVTETQNNDSWGGFRGWGVDVTNKIDELQLVSGFPQGKFNIYYDVNGDAVKSIVNTTTNQYTLLSSDKNDNPRTAIIRRDSNGKITCLFNGVEMTMPSYDKAPYLSEAENAENLYVWIGGLSSVSNWKIDYFGPIRDYVEPEPESPTDPDTPVTTTFDLGEYMTYDDETSTLRGVSTSYQILISKSETSKAEATFQQPLTKGKELEIVYRKDTNEPYYPGKNWPFVIFGLDRNSTTKNVAREPSYQFMQPDINVYFDLPANANGEGISMFKQFGAAIGGGKMFWSDKSFIKDTENGLTIKFKRDNDGVVTMTINDVPYSFEDFKSTASHIELAEQADNLYFMVSGLNNSTYVTINYFGDIREN